jgi:hypothetical protein
MSENEHKEGMGEQKRPKQIKLNPHLRFLWRAVDLNTKLRKIFNGKNFTVKLNTK